MAEPEKQIFEQQVAETLIARATGNGQVQIGVLEDHINLLAPWIVMAIEAAADAGWSHRVEDGRWVVWEAALAALRGGDV